MAESRINEFRSFRQQVGFAARPASASPARSHSRPRENRGFALPPARPMVAFRRRPWLSTTACHGRRYGLTTARPARRART